MKSSLYPGYIMGSLLTPLMPDTQQIHIKLPAELHKRLRVQCAVEGVTMQDYVTGLVEKATKGVVVKGVA